MLVVLVLLVVDGGGNGGASKSRKGMLDNAVFVECECVSVCVFITIPTSFLHGCVGELMCARFTCSFKSLRE